MPPQRAAWVRADPRAASPHPCHPPSAPGWIRCADRCQRVPGAPGKTPRNPAPPESPIPRTDAWARARRYTPPASSPPRQTSSWPLPSPPGAALPVSTSPAEDSARRRAGAGWVCLPLRSRCGPPPQCRRCSPDCAHVREWAGAACPRHRAPVRPPGPVGACPDAPAATSASTPAPSPPTVVPAHYASLGTPPSNAGTR